MIRLTITDADVRQCGMTKVVDGAGVQQGWAVVSHGINIVYCDTEEEARRAREAINGLARALSETGEGA